MKALQLLSTLAASGRVRLVDWMNWALGCSHRHTSFPLSVRSGGLHGGQPAAPPQVFVVCLSCGMRLSHTGPRRATAWWCRWPRQEALIRQLHRGLK